MKVRTRLTTAISLALVTGTVLARPVAADPPTTCTSGLTIFTTSTGTVTTTGEVTHFQDSGVGGSFTSGFLSGDTLSGAQDIVVNNRTNQSQLHGSFTAVGPGGNLTLRYTGHVDLNTGAATGHFVSAEGTGQFGTFHWQGSTSAQLISLAPPTFVATDSGPCDSAG